MSDAHPHANDPQTAALTRLLAAVTEEIMFALSAAPGDAGGDAIDGTVKRRKDAHAALLQGHPISRMTENFDAWFIDMSRAMAPIHPPSFLPMSGVIDEKVTLEVGARGLRSLFSSKPSDKDVARVKNLGALAVRVLRAVFAADGPINSEEARAISSIVTAANPRAANSPADTVRIC